MNKIDYYVASDVAFLVPGGAAARCPLRVECVRAAYFA